MRPICVMKGGLPTTGKLGRLRLTTQWRATFRVKSFKVAVITTDKSGGGDCIGFCPLLLHSLWRPLPVRLEITVLR